MFYFPVYFNTYSIQIPDTFLFASASCPPAGDPAGDFHLHPSTGALSTSQGLDREARAEYTLEVVASDRGSPPLSTTVTVQVHVVDVNDNSPIFSKSSYFVDVAEDVAEGSRVLEVHSDYRGTKMCFVYTSK